MTAVIEKFSVNQIIVAHRVPTARAHHADAAPRFCRHRLFGQNRKRTAATPEAVERRIGLIALLGPRPAEFPLLRRKVRDSAVDVDSRLSRIAARCREHRKFRLSGRRHNDTDCLTALRNGAHALLLYRNPSCARADSKCSRRQQQYQQRRGTSKRSLPQFVLSSRHLHLLPMLKIPNTSIPYSRYRPRGGDLRMRAPCYGEEELCVTAGLARLRYVAGIQKENQKIPQLQADLIESEEANKVTHKS